jgi:hypothetical protein
VREDWTPEECWTHARQLNLARRPNGSYWNSYSATGTPIVAFFRRFS